MHLRTSSLILDEDAFASASQTVQLEPAMNMLLHPLPRTEGRAIAAPIIIHEDVIHKLAHTALVKDCTDGGMERKKFRMGRSNFAMVRNLTTDHCEYQGISTVVPELDYNWVIHPFSAQKKFGVASLNMKVNGIFVFDLRNGQVLHKWNKCMVLLLTPVGLRHHSKS